MISHIKQGLTNFDHKNESGKFIKQLNNLITCFFFYLGLKAMIFFICLGIPDLKMDLTKILFEDWLPLPFVVAMLIEKSFVIVAI